MMIMMIDATAEKDGEGMCNGEDRVEEKRTEV
jgi:hypothetical protein